MSEVQQDKSFRFDGFEFSVLTGELRKGGVLVRLQGQPARLLGLLVSRSGELVTRTEIQQVLWPDGRFVEFEHAINTAIKKVREALGDDPENPRFIETLPKLGYRFLAQLETTDPPARPVEVSPFTAERRIPKPSDDDEFSIPYPRVSRFLFLVIQVGYIAIYCAALYYMSALETALNDIGFVPVNITLPALLVIAMCGLAVRLYLLSAVGWRHPAASQRFLRLFPAILLLDALWAACPLLATPVLGPGLALAAVAGMAYLPFAQRTLIQSVYRDVR